MKGKPRKVLNHGRERWQVDSRDPVTGKRCREYFDTQKAANDRQREVSSTARLNLNPAFDPNASLATYGEHFLASHRAGWKPRTYDVNADALRLYVFPFPIGGGRTLGDVKVRELTRGHGKAFALGLRDRIVQVQGDDGQAVEVPAYADGTLRIAYATLRSVLNSAVDDEVIPANPVAKLGKHLSRPKRATDDAENDVKAFEAEQLATFLATAERISELYPLYLSGALAGLRLGELCGWQLSDLHLEDRERWADVRRSLGQECSVRDPKPSTTKTGRERTVDLSTTLAAVLADIVAKRPARAMARGWRPVPLWVFVTGNGTPYSQRNVSRDFKRVLDKAGLSDHFSPHSLRHTFATLHLLNGAKPQWVQQQLGHASIKITVDTYGSWIRERNPAAADSLAALVAGSVAGSGA